MAYNDLTGDGIWRHGRVDRDEPASRADVTRHRALLDSRRRWRDLVTIATDIAYETDEWAAACPCRAKPRTRWSTDILIDQPAEPLLAGPITGGGCNPFRAPALVRRRSL